MSILGVACAVDLRFTRADAGPALYRPGKFGNARLLHITDVHGQLLPIYYREPHVNLGVGAAAGRPPHLVGQHLIDRASLGAGRLQHAFTHLAFTEAARQYGKVGGFAYLRTLVRQLRADYPEGGSLLLDGGDTWQGSATALWTRGGDMVQACNLLGVDVMTGHWEFTYPDRHVLANLERFNGEFVAQNIRLTEEGLFDGQPAYDEETGHVFPPYAIKQLGGRRIGVIGQAFPYTPIANPRRFVPHWRFGIREQEIQAVVDELRSQKNVDAVVLLSHNGMDVDLKLASRVSGIDAILGGHTHDAMPFPVLVDGPGGRTIVTNAGSHGKFLGVLDLDIGKGVVKGFEYRLLPVFSRLLDADREMAALIDTLRAPYRERLKRPLGTAATLLYRRGNFNGTFDQLICDAQRLVGDAEIAFSPGFRWGTTVLPGQRITMEDVMNHTAITYPQTYVREMSGAEIKRVLEAVCDNLFNPDPYYQQGGDMVRVAGLRYACDPNQTIGRRISELTLDDGELIDARRRYKVAGWAAVADEAQGPPIWKVVEGYLADRDTVDISTLNTPKLKNVAGNPGITAGGFM